MMGARRLEYNSVRNGQMDSTKHDLINIIRSDSLIESYLQFHISHYVQSKAEAVKESSSKGNKKERKSESCHTYRALHSTCELNLKAK
ncbi:CLUMA_CG007817, isoform A [Clunio marinus]|uniref:CLUMA_CG007817, isoform A n=1 Tax=Clunio marinus TaxID=568069 RepID=A0A1J1I5T4_9DIPT|nr:CLUMA_CG007817, isoform A [Clunio marinus]